MNITTNIGQKIIKRIAEYTDVQINIMNLNGMIVASTDKNRINETHTGAIEVIKTGNALTLDKQLALHYPGTKPGVNLPLKHQDQLTGVVGVSGDPEEIKKVYNLIRAVVEIVMDQIHVQRQVYYQDRQWNYWLQQLLHPSGFNEIELEKESSYSFNVNTNGDWKIIILKGKTIQNSLELVRQEVVQMKIHILFTLSFSENKIVICVPSEFRRTTEFINRLINLISSDFRAGIGEEAFGITGVRESYFQAKQALLFESNSERIIYSEHWKLKRLITAIPKEKYEQICLPYEHLLHKLGENYIYTIDVFLEDYSIKETAKILHIHRNTLLYRLNKIEEKTGLNPRVFQDALMLKIIRNWYV